MSVLAVPFGENIKGKNTLKSNTYAYKTIVTTFEVGSGDYFTVENYKRLKKNPAYGRQSISRPMRIVAPIPQ